jgi:hypothetical protein
MLEPVPADWALSSGWLERFPDTEEVTSSSLVGPTSTRILSRSPSEMRARCLMGTRISEPFPIRNGQSMWHHGLNSEPRRKAIYGDVDGT